MSALEVHPATDADLAFIVACNRAMAAETEDLGLDPATLEAGIRYLLANPREGFYLVARDGGEDVGTLMVTFEWSDWRNGRFWWIQSVYVTADARRRGVYRAMHERVRTLAAADPQACGLRLYVEKENAAAQQTYLNIGMHETRYRLYEELFSG